MKVGIGYCNEEDAFVSGKKVIEKAMQSNDLDTAHLVMAFCSGSVDHEQFFSGIKSVIGKKTPVIGGSAVGVITNDSLSYEGWPTAAAVIQSESLKYKITTAGDLDKNEEIAASHLVNTLEDDDPDSLFLLFYDSVKIPPTDLSPPVLNASSPILKGVEKRIKKQTPIIGAGLIADYDFSPTIQFCGETVQSQHITGTLLKGNFTPYFRITHGCTPLDGIYHTITNMKGSVIYELDGKPIVQMIDELYGNTDWKNQNPVKLLTIGINHGNQFSYPDEAVYVNRLIMGVLPGDKGISLFEPDLAEGAEIQFMLRDTETMMTSARINTEEILKRIDSDGKNPIFGLYFDCAGRTAAYSNIIEEEAAIVQKSFKLNGIPLLGFYSGVEIAPMLGKSRGLDWTGVLMILAEDEN